MASAISELGIRDKLDTFVSREYIMNRERQSLLVGAVQTNRLFETFKNQPQLINNDDVFNSLMKELNNLSRFFNIIKERGEFIFDFELIEVLVYCTRYYWTERDDLFKNQSINQNIKKYILSASEIFFRIYENILAILNTHSLNYIINLYEYSEDQLAIELTNKKFIDKFLPEVRNNYYLFRFMCLTFLVKTTIFFNLPPNEINDNFNDNKDRSDYNVQSLLEELAVLFSEELFLNIIIINNKSENKLSKEDLIDIKAKLNLISQYFYRLSDPASGCYLTDESSQKSTEVVANDRGEEKAAVSAESVAQAEEARRSLLEEENRKEEEEKKKEEEKRRKRREKKKRQKQRRREAEAKAAAEEAAKAAKAAAEEAAKAAAAQAVVETEEKHAAEQVLAETKQDTFKLRISDITSYLTEKNISLKREQNKKFEQEEDAILQFIRQLNKKIAQTQYKLVITGGYAIRLHGGNNKTSDVDMVLCYNTDVRTARNMIATKIYEVMNEQEMDMTTNNVLVLSPNKEATDPTNPVKIRINGVQAIDITFKINNDKFCKEIEVISGFFVLKADFMKRNLMEITNNFRQKRIDSIISHDGKLVSWLHQMTSLNKLLLGRSRTPSPVTTKSGGRKTRRKKRRKTKKRVKKRRKTKKRVKKRKKTRSRKK